ncbi:type II toxin-antitoxin system antitoxin SocA domain-containing protein [Fusobacterium necrophorum]|uniref:type II toxin-antitoxin system antitoxin SocA domain-containing protein n=1 Tax=Fusobacterium necrophorum TaxID=859 RepID=UPI00241CEC7A
MNKHKKLFKICSMIQTLMPDTENIVKSKSLYIIQAYHLLLYDIPAFEETIEAWMYGPSVEKAVLFFKFPEMYDYSDLSEELKNIITNVCDSLKNIPPHVLVWYMMNLETYKKHWISNKKYKYDAVNYAIPIEEIKKYHKKIYEETGSYFPPLKRMKGD